MANYGNVDGAPMPTKEECWQWLCKQPISDEKVEKSFVTFDDFLQALKSIKPLALREGFATVPNVTWEQVGALSEIKEELKMSILVF